jgi:pullulanase/glycogen debranching enzyme
MIDGWRFDSMVVLELNDAEREERLAGLIVDPSF